MEKLYTTRKHAYITLLIAVLMASLFIQALAEKPSWAEKGVWLRYEATLSGNYYNYTIHARVVSKETFTEVNDNYGVIKPELESVEVTVNPPNEDLKKQFEDYVRGSMREVTVYWSECSIDYCPVNQLPKDGVIMRENGKYVYDTSTGLLKEATISVGGAQMTIRLIESSLGGGLGGGLPWWIIIVVVVVIVIALGVVFIVRIGRRARYQQPVPPPPPPPPPPQ